MHGTREDWRATIGIGLVQSLACAAICLGMFLLQGCEHHRERDVVIERIASSAWEQELIRTAEEVYPDRADVVEAASNPVWGIPEEELPQERLWYWGDAEWFLIPYAITGDAVDYFQALSEEWWEREPAARVSHLCERGKLHYRAEALKAPKDEYRVRMDLHYTTNCGGLQLKCFREVSFTSSGEVYSVEGDGLFELVIF